VCGDVGREVIRLTHFQGDLTQGQGPYLLLTPYPYILLCGAVCAHHNCLRFQSELAAQRQESCGLRLARATAYRLSIVAHVVLLLLPPLLSPVFLQGGNSNTFTVDARIRIPAGQVKLYRLVSQHVSYVWDSMHNKRAVKYAVPVSDPHCSACCRPAWGWMLG
jgi:hypothetical protein